MTDLLNYLENNLPIAHYCGFDITKPLLSMKKLTEALEEHWKAALHAAIGETAR